MLKKMKKQNEIKQEQSRNPKADLKKNKAETWPGEAWANNKTEQLLTVAGQITQRPPWKSN